MAGVGNNAENLMLDWILATGTPTRPSGVYLALFTAAPDYETGEGGTEATGGSYAREELTFGAASGGSAANTSGPHDFVVGTNLAADDYVAYGLYDANTAGNFLAGNALSETRSVNSTGDTIRFAVGSITVAQD